MTRERMERIIGNVALTMSVIAVLSAMAFFGLNGCKW
jgi:hypothetical protein